MISNVIFVGFTAKNIGNGKRFIRIKSDDAFKSDPINSMIPVLYWSRDINNPITNLNENQKLLISGRLESDNEIGLFVIVELFQLL